MDYSPQGCKESDTTVTKHSTSCRKLRVMQTLVYNNVNCVQWRFSWFLTCAGCPSVPVLHQLSSFISLSIMGQYSYLPPDLRI